ncbi:MAG: hypothetical protein J6V26_04850 [Alistipes sp.]|nr:hypothetical protein [Alistipes sp.]
MFTHYRTTDQTKAAEYAEAIISITDPTLASAEVAEVYDFLATYSETTLHHYLCAVELLEHSHNMYMRASNTAKLIETKANLSRLYLRIGDYHKAYSNAIAVLDMTSTHDDEDSLREAYLVLEQVIYFYHKDYDMAMEYNHHVASTYDGREQAHQTVRALNTHFTYQESIEQIDTIVAQAVEICEEYEFNDLLVNLYLNMSMYKLQQQDTEASEHYLNIVKGLISNFKEEGYYYAALGFYNLNIGDVQQAIESLNRSVELLDSKDFNSKNVHSYFLLQDIYYSAGLYAEAYEALMKFAEIYTYQHSASNVVELSMLITDLEMERAAEERRLLEEHHQLQQEKGRLMLYFLIFGLVITVGIVALVYSRYRLERKNRELQRRQAEQDINYKNEIIKVQRLQQYQEQTNMDKLSEVLNNAINITDNKEMRTELRRIIRQMQQHTGNGDWVEVETTLVGMNDVFFDNLLKEFPNLTKNERKLCTLIHMNLSTKEIANITHQSTGSINVARSRLRQKFGLTDSDTSLIAFLDRFKGER